MATRGPDGQHIISAGEVGAFSVCPLSWKLKWIDREDTKVESSVELGKELHQSWSSLFEESLLLAKWIRYLAVLLCSAGVFFLLIQSPKERLDDIFFVSVQSHGLQLIVLAAASLLVMRSFRKAAHRRHRDSGFALSEIAVAIEGSSILPSREYISVKQGLAGKPDAILREGDFILPVERKPLAKNCGIDMWLSCWCICVSWKSSRGYVHHTATCSWGRIVGALRLRIKSAGNSG